MALSTIGTNQIASEAVTVPKVADQVLTHRNLIINGAMQVAQRGTSSAGLGASSGYFTVDRFRMNFNTSGRLTMTQEAITDLPGFSNAIKLACTTADTSIAASENVLLQTRLEGQDLQQLEKGTSGAKPITLSFYVKGNAAATYTAELRDQDNTRYNGQEFSVTTSWNRISLTYVGDTTGAYADDNELSFTLGFFLHAGSTYTAGTFASNTWQTTTDKRVGDNQTSFFDSTDRTFFITGLQMEIGETATPFEHRSFGDELARCQRYFETSYNVGTAPQTATTVGIRLLSYAASGANSGMGHVSFLVPKRTTPTIETFDGAGTANKVSTTPNSTTFTDGRAYSGAPFGISTTGFNHQGQGAAGNLYNFIHFTAASEL